MDHKEKMQRKRREREMRYRQFSQIEYIPANLGRNHPDYGMSMVEHLAEKEEREKSS